MIDSPLPQLDRLFDYAVPDALAGDVAPGVRVRVPLRSAGRVADGFVVELVSEVAWEGELSEIDSVVSGVRVLAPEVWSLARRVADRAAGTASDVVRLAVPKRQVRVEKAWFAEAPVPAAGTREAVPESPAAELPDDGDGADHADEEGVRPYARSSFDRFVSDRSRAAIDAVPRLALLEYGPAAGHWVGQWAMTVAALASRAIAAGESAILAVPDYRDQEQLMAALSAVVPSSQIVHLDARQSNPDRYRALLACLGDTPLAIVGTRSVVYAPAARLGLIAIWDDGDPLHAEPLSPYVHSRDAALVRQEQQDCALAFVAHARSTEVERLVELGYLGQLSPERSYAPRVVPTAQQNAQDGFAASARIPSTAWREARSALEHGPVLVQVARPGYAPALSCLECAHAARCTRCDGPLRTVSAASIASCAWCATPAVGWHCRHCDGVRFTRVGHGSIRTADDLGRAFPGVRVIIADGDHPVLRVGDEPALVVATRGAEPIAEGGYRAVLLLDGERMLARETLRVGEDCLRWWSNAAALAAPGAAVMLVGVGGALASAMTTWRSDAYAARELVDRRSLRFPPAVRVATATGSADAVERLVEAALAVTAEPAVDEVASGAIDVLGPVEVEGGGVRAILRFDFALGPSVAAAVRAELVRNATSRRKRMQPTTGRGHPPPPRVPTLRVRFDDVEPFSE